MPRRDRGLAGKQALGDPLATYPGTAMGLFAHYQADPASVYTAAADTEARVKPLASLRGGWR